VVAVSLAGAVSLAYLLEKKPAKGKKVVPILSGGNVDMYLLGQIVAKGLTEMGRMVKIFIILTDKPGALKEVVDQISALSVNIVEVIHDRLSSSIPAGTAGVTLSLETQDQDHAEQLIKFLKKKSIQFKIVT
jgi:threonine dehydratase